MLQQLILYQSLCLVILASNLSADELGRATPKSQTFDVVLESLDAASQGNLERGQIASVLVRFESNVADHGATLPPFSDLRFDAGMPSHGHGMVVTPRVTAVNATTFRVDGVKFHMPGLWQVGVAVIAGKDAVVVAIPFHVKE